MQAAVPGFVVGWQLDVLYRVVHMDAPFLAGHFEEVGEDHKVAFDGGGCDLFEAAVAVAGDVHAANAGHDPLRQGEPGQGAEADGFRCCALFQWGDFFPVAVQQFLERCGFRLGAGHEDAPVHFVLDLAGPLFSGRAGVEGFALRGMALFPDLCLPLVRAALSECRHCHTPPVRERV